MIVLIIVRKTCRNGPKSGCLLRKVKTMCVGSTHNQSYLMDRFVIYLMLFYNVIKCTFVTIMRIFGAGNVIGNCAEPFSLFKYIFFRHIDKLCFVVHETPY